MLRPCVSHLFDCFLHFLGRFKRTAYKRAQFLICLLYTSGSVQENLTNVRVVKSFVRQDFEKKKFKISNDNLTDASLRAMNVVIFSMPVMMLVMNLSTVAVVWFGGGQVIGGRCV